VAGRRLKFVRLVAGACVIALTKTTLAWADDAADSQLQEIVVYAQKQETSLQKSPVAITAITDATLKQANIITPVDLNGQVPGLVITTSEGYDLSVSVRGIGFNVPQTDAAQPSVSYHEDGIYIDNPIALNSGFLDVDHVEVLRGPQGTVFGQNSIGGAINVISKQPSLDGLAGYVEASSGSFDLVHTSAAVNVPLSDIFAVRFAYDQNYQHGDATATAVPGGYDLGNQNNVHARLLALLKPSDELSFLTRVEYSQANQHEAEGKSIADPNPNAWQETSDWPGRFIYNQQLAAETVTFNFASASLKVLSSYQEVNQKGSVNQDGLDLALTNDAGEPHDVEYFLHNSKSLTNEFDLSSNPGGPLDWIVGGFYLKSRLTVAYDQYDVFAGEGVYPDDATPDLLGITVPDEAINNAINEGLLYFQSTGVEDRRSWSGYGQSTYHLSDSLRITAGLRYTHDHNSTLFSDYYGPPIFVQQTSTKLTYRVETDYDVTPENLLYVSVSTGFKPGGGNISNAPAVVPFQFEPETITAYELGSKNGFLDKKLTVNAAAFVYRDKDMQFQAEDLINYQGGVDNIPDVLVYGAEAEASALLPWDVRLDGNVTVEKGRVTAHFLALDNVAGNAANQTFINEYGMDAFYNVVYTGSPELNALRSTAYRDVYGNAPPSLPEVMATVNVSRTAQLSDSISLLSRVSAQYRSDYADTIFGKTPVYTAPSYVMTNLYFDFVYKPGSWDVALGINNVFDRVAVLSRFTNQYGGETTQQYFPPREFVLNFNYRF
jgi:iron complex outermembrane receptor protein